MAVQKPLTIDIRINDEAFIRMRNAVEVYQQKLRELDEAARELSMALHNLPGAFEPEVVERGE